MDSTHGVNNLADRVRQIAYHIHAYHGHGYLEKLCENALSDSQRSLLTAISKVSSFFSAICALFAVK
jgi:hypothetical protein